MRELVNEKSVSKKGGRLRKKKMEGKIITPKPLVYLGVIFLALITQVPFVFTLYFSTLKWNLLYPDMGKVYVGFENFSNIFQSEEFLNAFGVTLKITSLTLFFSLSLGLLLALLVQRDFLGKTIVRSMLFAPFLVMTTVSTVVWKNMMFDPSYGFFAYIFKMFGLTPIDIIGNHATFAITMISVWTWTPFMFLILHAALGAVPKDIIEAASIDGAGSLSITRYIVLPFLRKYILICILLGAIMILPLFAEIALVTGGGPGDTTTNLSYLVYKLAFQRYSIGDASAAGVVTVIFTIIIGSILIWIFNREEKE